MKQMNIQLHSAIGPQEEQADLALRLRSAGVEAQNGCRTPMSTRSTLAS